VPTPNEEFTGAAREPQTHPRLHVPFGDRWAMRMKPTVSVAVRAGAVVATCGQCDLDFRGRALNEPDLAVQIDNVGAHLRHAILQAGGEINKLGRVDAFYVPDPRMPEDVLRSRLLAAVPGIAPSADVLLVPLPYFYYDGMKVEIDGQLDEKDRLRYLTVDGGRGRLADDVRFGMRSLEAGLTALGTSLSRLVQLRTYFVGPDQELIAARGEALAHVPCTDVPLTSLPEGAGRVRMSAIAALGDGRIERFDVPDERFPQHRRTVAARTADGLVFIGGLAALDERGRVVHQGDAAAQTETVMRTLESLLERCRAQMSDLVKVGVHYRGGPTPADLHRNLRVRSRFYPRPGPASTGVPVARLMPETAEVVLDALVVT
jgi:enamine deaminase RidA (YjgF/YER057c/UK114 family)